MFPICLGKNILINFKKTLTVVCLLGFLNFGCLGAAANSGPIEKIIIEGNQRIEALTIQSYLLLRVGESFDRQLMNQTLKSLYATGYFSDVAVTRVSNSLLVKVVENPVINRIAFEGNLRLDDEILEPEISLKPRVVYSRTRVQKAVRRIIDIYRANGRFAAIVTPKIITRPQNRIDLVFEIQEGPLTKISNIRFIGNKNFDDDDLRGIILTKESRWYRFLSSSDNYDPGRMKADQSLIRDFYLSKGYADFEVISSVAELTPDKKAFFLTFSIKEGERYKFGKINVNNGVPEIKNEELLPLIEAKKGGWFDNTVIKDTAEAIEKAVSTRGYAFVRVRPELNKRAKSKEVDVSFLVKEGNRVFVDRINIQGNVRTADSVIRREFKVVEGDAFNSAKLAQSRQKIQDLNFFNKVTIKNKRGSTPDKVEVDLEVEEKSTGSLNFGVGYGTDAGPLIDLTLRERNLLGKGQSLSLSTQLAASKTAFNLSFTEPYFRGRDVAAGFDLFHIERDRQDVSSYDLKNTGAGLRTSFSLSEEVRQSWEYGYTITDITKVAATASNLIKAQEGTRQISEIGHVIVHDTRDSKLNPTLGNKVSMSNDLAGLGGDVSYFRNDFSGTNYYTPFKDWLIASHLRLGHILGISEDVQIPERFFLGGSTLRGFAQGGVGPRDRTTLDALGGELIYNGYVETSMPIGLPADFAIRGRLFSDFGGVTGVSPSNANVFDDNTPRVSIGMGLGWVSPFGPVSLDFAHPVKKEDLDQEEKLRFNIGTRF